MRRPEQAFLRSEAQRSLTGILPTPKRHQPTREQLGFRAFLEAPDYCGLVLSPVMSALVDASAGTPPGIGEGECRLHFGCGIDGLPTEQRRTVNVRAGLRAGKSTRLLAGKALHAAFMGAIPTLSPGEIPSCLIVAPTLKLARQTLSFVAGYIQASPKMRGRLVKEPTADEVLIRRETGQLVRIEILAATAGGSAVRARTLLFAGLEEAAFFYDKTSVVNDVDVYNAVEPRVVPGGQTWIVSTPWAKGVGLLEENHERDWGKHVHALCFTGGTRALNPTWDPTGEIERALRARDPESAQREIDGIPLSGVAINFFEDVSLTAAIDVHLLMPRQAQPGDEVTAGADFGFRRNSSALAIVHRHGAECILAELHEERPAAGEPLRPSRVVAKFAAAMRTHSGLESVTADGHYRESVVEHLNDADLSLCDAPSDVSAPFVRARTLLREKRVRLPSHPRLLSQLRQVQWRANAGGSISIILPTDPSGAHADLVSALVLALWEASGLEVATPPPKAGSPAYFAAEQERMIASMERNAARRYED